MIGATLCVLALIALTNAAAVTCPDPCTAQADALRANATDVSGASTPDSWHTPSTPPVKHDPTITSITVDGENIVVRVVVRGNDGSDVDGMLHPQVNGHWISHIYLKDQDGAVVAFEEIAEPAMGDTTATASHTFTLAKGAITALTPYELCNLHGLWEGPATNVETTTETTAGPAGPATETSTTAAGPAGPAAETSSTAASTQAAAEPNAGPSPVTDSAAAHSLVAGVAALAVAAAAL